MGSRHFGSIVWICVDEKSEKKKDFTFFSFSFFSSSVAYYSVNGFFASAIGEESCRVSDFQSWGLNTSTGKPRVSVPNAKTRQQLAEKLLVD